MCKKMFKIFKLQNLWNLDLIQAIIISRTKIYQNIVLLLHSVDILQQYLVVYFILLTLFIEKKSKPPLKNSENKSAKED